MTLPSETPLGLLIGSWEFEATRDGRLLGRGRAAFEWIEEGAFVRERAEDRRSADTDPEWIAHSPMPVISILGFDDATGSQVMMYSDARGVFRIYQMALSHDAWRVWREAPGFHQRYLGTVRDDGRTIQGRWESSPDGSGWETDFDLTYRRLADEPRRAGTSNWHHNG